MAKKQINAETKVSQNKGNQEEKIPTDVILVVKGGGDQKPDAHLHKFVNGFWPAVTSLYPNSTIKQVHEPMDDYDPTPHDKDAHKHLTEIDALDSEWNLVRRIWVREAYWEPEVIPTNPITSVLKEWRLASFAFRSLIVDPAIELDTKELQKARQEKGAMKKEKIKKIKEIEGKIKANNMKPLSYIGRFWFMLFLVFFPLVLIMLESDDWIANMGVAVVASFILSIAPGWENARIIKYRESRKQEDVEAMRSLPAFPGWIFFFLLITLVFNPAEYLIWMGIVAGLQLSFLIARAFRWKSRKHQYSDTDAYDYYNYKDPEDGKDKVGRTGTPMWKLLFKPFIYRYFVFLLVPIMFIGGQLVRFFKATRILSGVGTALEKLIRTALSGYLGDVSLYAMDPSFAQRIRDVVESEIEYFVKVKNVDRVHVFAHSQGTPITYETMFHYLDQENQKRIHTYITIGSVLSLFHHARGVLDPIYHRRFPVDENKKQGFSDTFRWFNFWNFSDFIAEFYGLDEYVRFEKVDKNTGEPVPTKTSPINIRSKFSLPKNHGEYWSNLDEIHIPFAKRLLSVNLDAQGIPDEWIPENKKGNPSHPRSLVIMWIVAIALFLLLIYSIPLIILGIRNHPQFSAVVDFLINTIQSVISPAGEQPTETTDPSFWGNIYTSLKDNWEVYKNGILNSFLIVTGVIAVIEWALQLRRAIKTGKGSIDESLRGLNINIIEIEGIGEVYAEKLRQAGINTIKNLLVGGAPKTGRNKIAKETGISKTYILEWVNLADLMRVEGIGPEYSDLLEEAGVDTVKELRRRNPLNLYKKIKEVEKKKNLVRKLPSQNDVEVWVNEAKRIKPMVTY